MDTKIIAENTGEPEGGGNINTTPVKDRRSRNWVFTFNNYDEESEHKLRRFLDEKSDCYIYQHEVGESGTPHLQGFMAFKNPVKFSRLQKIVPWWIEPSRASDINDAINYCRKEGGTDIICKNIPDKLVIPVYDWRPWQQGILELVETMPQNRHIYWYWDAVGGSGKTTLAKNLVLSRKDCVYVTGKAADCKYFINGWVKAGKPLRIVIFDFVRSIETFVSYEALESIKNGLFFTTKYESDMCAFNSPHVIVFANFYPDVNKLSEDRWKIVNIAEG